jgi:hypothetical protein
MTPPAPEAAPRCHRCGAVWQGAAAQPGAYVHCCLNCRFRNPSLHNQCAIPETDWVGDRKHLNFCEQFEFARRPEAGAAPGPGGDARDRFGALFGDGASADPPGPKGFDDLFRGGG